MIFKNETFELGEESRHYVLLGVIGEADGQRAIIIDKYAKKAFPQEHSMAWLRENARPLDPGNAPRKLVSLRDGATEASKSKANLRWDQIKDIVDNTDLYREGCRWTLVTSQAEAKKCSPNTILTALRLWWQGGQNRDALLGYRPKAKPEKSDSQEQADDKRRCMRGRPATKEGAINYRACQSDKVKYKDVIDTYYLIDGRVTAAAAYKELLYRHYSPLDGNKKKALQSSGAYPSLRQFKIYLDKNYSTEQKLRQRKGDKEFDRNHRKVFGTVNDICDRPGQIYEMDSTIVDMSIVSSEGRHDIIGRPTLFIIIDRKSRLIVGWYIGLEMASWDTALQAIFSIAEDKRALCKRLGIEYDPQDWVAQGVLCEQLLVDRGESTSRRANSLVPLNVTLSNLTACRPDWKPLVEGGFRLTHQAISDAPGYNPASNAMKRRSKNYSDTAALTLEEAEKIIVRWFIAHNRTIMKHYELTREQYRDKVEPSPINIFSHGIRTQSGQMRRFTADELKLALLPSAGATVDENGLWVNGMCYQPDNGENPHWFVEGRCTVGAVQVSYDNRRVDKIYVHDQRLDEGYFLASLARHSVKYRGLSLAEAKWMQEGEEVLAGGAAHSERAEAVRYKADTRGTVEAAKRETAAAKKGRSKTSRRNNTKEVRKEELQRERERTAIPISTSTTSDRDVAPATPVANVAQLKISSTVRDLRTQLFEGMSL